MALGDDRFTGVINNFEILLKNHGVMVNVTRTIQEDIKERDIFGTPEGYSPKKFDTKILVTDQHLDELAILVGGKKKEVIKFIGTPGTFLENDEFKYNSHTYQVKDVGKTVLGGSNSLEMYTASREVEASV